MFIDPVAKKRYQAVGFPCNRMLKLSSSRGIRIDVPVLSDPNPPFRDVVQDL